ncbi:MAG: sarcosine oxidase subunit gamma family protein [Paracoccaceae bacterium]|nr:sarcosine oxidase subunit gamma family protein [Paracoccaceae bacterium]
MARLIAKGPFDGVLPLEEGAVRVSAVDPGPITFVRPLHGQDEAVSAALEKATGAALPAPGTVATGRSARALWCGPGAALVLGAAVEDLPGAAIVDQSDGWAVARVEGADASAVLARLTPLDLRPAGFGAGQTARTLLGHMTAQITPVGENAFEVMVFRSMAESFVHELRRAMGFVAGRARIG